MEFSRRHFIASTSASSIAALGVPNLLLGETPGANERLRVAVMGLSRGQKHISYFQEVPNVEVVAVCDVDSNRMAAAAKLAGKKQKNAPRQEGDIRKLIEDPEIDAISIAAPNFWHAPATIMACKAGKHVYVEKPGSHTPDEAARMVAVAKQTKRLVQMGTQRRSYPNFIEGIQKLREGAIGKLRFARCWYTNQRPSIGRGKVGKPPAHLDWTLWQGPVPERPYKSNLVHYNWHWHWFYGGGEMANNGVHSLDIARWALDVDVPRRVTCGGGRFHFDDDQETPDTINASFDFGELGITWESSSHHRRKPETLPAVRVYGEGGMLEFTSDTYRIFDKNGAETGANLSKQSQVPHFANFVDAIRDGKALTQPIDDAQKSTMLCHYANIAYRTDGACDIDTETGRVKGLKVGDPLWTRKYRDGWEA